MKSNVSPNSSPTEFTCTFCAKVFKREKAFAAHVCRQKRRFFEKDTKAARLALHAFVHFHEVHYRGRIPPTHDKFMQSTLYDAFLDFGKYILDIDAIDPRSYIDYMVRSGIPIDRWCRDAEYEKYVANLTAKESPDRAFERSIILMEEWAVSQKARWQDFFREVSPGLAVRWLISGRISPWVMLNCSTGQALLGRLTDEQMTLIKPAINVRFWNGKFSRHTEAVADIQSTLESEGL
jgi:hypothetical protein